MYENPANVILDDAQANVLIVCEVCGQSVTRQDYDRHLRTHKEKRVEVCQICYKSFTSKSFNSRPRQLELEFQFFLRYQQL